MMRSSWFTVRGWWILFICVGVWLCLSCRQTSPQDVIIYISQDQQFAEPILNEFAKETGIKVRAVYDNEAVKTVGLANRLIAESKHPRCDLWWSNEALRTWQLAQRGVLQSNSIVEFGYRSRQIVINTNQLTITSAPKSLIELTNVEWRGKVALAYPMFGTTSAQFLALRQNWGTKKWETWCKALAGNKPFLVDGNSVVVKLVGRGEAAIGLTDFDDIRAGEREGLPVMELPISGETVLIPNTVALIRGARHPVEAKRLLEYLSSDVVRTKLIAAGALEGMAPGAMPRLHLNWNTLLLDLDPATETMRQIFLR
jgi:iron(III) transport system substrate-binding protein